jgi:S1-C subfamily serine protease
MKISMLVCAWILLAPLFPVPVLGQSPVFDEGVVVKIFRYDNIEMQDIKQGENTLRIAVPVVGHGSGVMIDSRGVILTAGHMAKDARFLTIYVPGYKFFYPAEVVYVDDNLDFAFILVEGAFQKYQDLVSPQTELKKGDKVWAYGYPMIAGEPDPSITSGNFSRFSPTFKMLQTDAMINPGNSGGPLVNENGEIVGIIAAGLKQAPGMNYAVPISEVVRAYAELLSRGDIDDVRRKVAGRSIDRREIRRILASYLANMAIKDDPTLFRDSEFVEAGKRIAAGREVVVNEMADMAALESAFYYNAAMAIMVNYNMSPKMPKEALEQVVDLLSRAILSAKQAADVDPTIRESGYIGEMEELYDAVMRGGKGGPSRGGRGSKETKPTTTDPEIGDASPRHFGFQAGLIFQRAVFQLNHSPEILPGVNAKDFGAVLHGWTLVVVNAYGQESESPAAGCMSYSASYFSSSESPRPTSIDSATTVKSYYVVQAGAVFQLSLAVAMNHFWLLIGAGGDLGCFVPQVEGDDNLAKENYFLNGVFQAGTRMRVGRLLGETTFHYRFGGDGMGTQINFGLGLLF